MQSQSQSQSQSAVPNQSVEEILASIRQAIADDESRRGRALKAVSPVPAPASDLPSAVAHTFASANDDEEWETGTDFETQNVIELAIEKAIDGVSAALSDTGPLPFEASEPITRSVSDADRFERRPDTRQNGPSAQPLLSARAGAAVAASLDDLARSVAGVTPAQVGDMARDMLRPMLKSWLDDNLPNLVERLVREEIERVSRGR
jgi:cell pole-organizing protein PopZ